MEKPTDRRRAPARPRARKRFGQHFLEPAWVSRLIDSLHPAPGDTFLEIGPGRGALTIPLASRVARLVAIEIDRDLAAALPAKLPSNAEIISGDALTINLQSVLERELLPVRMVGNLPYNVASPILFRLLHEAGWGTRLADATVMLQKEVADRLAAQPGSRDYGALAIQAALAADVTPLFELPPGAFRPPPKVRSAVVRLSFRPPRFEAGTVGTFERLVRGVFLQRRKTLANALAPVAATFGTTSRDLIDKAGLDGSRRPETLTPAEFGRLSSAVL